jgi:hypothetical protein
MPRVGGCVWRYGLGIVVAPGDAVEGGQYVMPIDADTRSTIALLVSIGSLVVSLGGVGVSAYNSLRDRPRLKVTSRFFDVSDLGSPRRIYVNVVNKGRRPVILRLLGGYDNRGEFSGTFFDQDKGGLRLGEHERHDFKIEPDDAFIRGPDGPEEPYERMWIEDSLGNRYAIPRSREYIRQLFSRSG